MKQDIQNLNFRNSPEAEQAVIGALLLESEAIYQVNDILTAEMFYSPKYGIIYNAISTLCNKGTKPSLPLVMKQLDSTGELTEIGGAYELSLPTTVVCSSIGIEDHARYVMDLYLSRKLAMAGMKILSLANDASLDVDDSINDSIKAIELISNELIGDSKLSDLSNLSIQSMRMYEERKRMSKNSIKIGITTGLELIDKATNGGFKPNELIILAARPAMGKTALALHFAKSAAKTGVSAVIFSLEMGAESLTNRLILSECNINSEKFKVGKLTDEDEMKLSNTVNELYNLPISVDDSAKMTIQKIKNRAKSLQRNGKCGIIFIDYLQLIDMRSSNKNYNRESEVSQCSRECKLLAKELKIPVVVLCQLSRQVEARAEKIPLLSDLRESGAIEQDADVVMFIHREEYYNKAAEPGKGFIRIAKQRDGACGDIPIHYTKNLSKFSDNPINEKFPF